MSFLPIRLLSKALVASLVAGLAICTALGGALFLEHVAQVERLEDGAERIAHMVVDTAQSAHVHKMLSIIGSTLADSIEKHDTRRLQTAISVVNLHPEILKIEVYNAQGQVLAALTAPSIQQSDRHTTFTIPVLNQRQVNVGQLRITRSLDLLVGAEKTIHTAILQRAASDRRGHIIVFTMLGMLSLLVCLCGGWWAGSRLRNAVMKLRRSTELLAAGDYENRIDLARKDEIGDLAQTVDYLRQRLKTTTVSRDHLDTVLNSMHDAILVTSPEGVIRRTNEATEKLLGWTEFELVGREFQSLLTASARSTFNPQALTDETSETQVMTLDGQTLPVGISSSEILGDATSFRGRIYVLHNITERKRAERRIRYLARYDTLTKIPNRMQFQHQLQQALARNLRQGRAIALLYIDLDRFKEVNDTFGHAAGDRTLEVLTERLLRLLPKDAAVGRLAGDEFAIYIEGLPGDDPRGAVTPICRQLLDGISGAFWLQGNEIFLSASIGVAVAPLDGENVVELVRNADAAMYHAKQNGGGTHAFYLSEMNTAAVERLMLKSKLHRAVEHDELVMMYQPKVDLRTGRIAGAEALLRWRVPGHGDISPAHFIPIAEESNLILAIGEWVLKRVCSEYAAWQKIVTVPGRISINLSLKQLRQASFITRCASVFREAGVPPTCFELEVTESTLMTDAKRTVKLLDELYAMGIHLSIDDFGTGYSSLSTLQQLPVGTIKIDQSFIAHLSNSEDDAALVQTMIEMGRNLKMEVVAEGVETTEQLTFLRARGCDDAPGMLLGKPMSGEDLLALLVAQAEGKAVFAEHFL